MQKTCGISNGINESVFIKWYLVCTLNKYVTKKKMISKNAFEDFMDKHLRLYIIKQQVLKQAASRKQCLRLKNFSPVQTQRYLLDCLPFIKPHVAGDRLHIASSAGVVNFLKNAAAMLKENNFITTHRYNFFAFWY